MHVLHCQNQFSRNESGKLFIKVLMHVQLLREVSMVTQFHHHMHVVWRLKCIKKFEHVSVIKLLHNLCFSYRISDLVLLD